MEFRFCPSCGKERIPGSKFCPFCGAQIPAAAPQESVPRRPPRRLPAGPAAQRLQRPPFRRRRRSSPAALNPPGAPVSPAAPTAQQPVSSPRLARPVPAGEAFPAQPVRRKNSALGAGRRACPCAHRRARALVDVLRPRQRGQERCRTRSAQPARESDCHRLYGRRRPAHCLRRRRRSVL